MERTIVIVGKRYHRALSVKLFRVANQPSCQGLLAEVMMLTALKEEPDTSSRLDWLRDSADGKVTMTLGYTPI